MAGKGGGAWKVAYADFVTAMMAFFLVMWITGQSKPVKQAVAKYFEDPIGTDSGSRSTSWHGPDDATTIGQFESGLGPSRGLAMATLKAEGKRNHVGVAATKPPKVIIFRLFNRTFSVGTVAQFVKDTVEIDANSKQRLEGLVPVLLGKPNKIEIRGFVLRAPLPPDSPYADQWQLSNARCLAVMKFMTDRGIDPKRLRISQEGDFEPSTLHVDSGERVGDDRVEVFALDEFVAKKDG
jgi:chemotaxis protein MotB